MILGYVSVFAIIVACVVGVYFMVKDMASRIKRQNKYCVDFSKSYNSKGLPIIPMTINGEEKFFLLDSGANGNHLNKKYFDTLNVVGSSESHEIQGHSGSSKAQLFEGDICSNGYEFEDVQFYVMDISTFNEHDYGCDIVGILGSPFFNKYKWIIDFDELVVWINK